jgi:hypothetical protein
MDRMVSATMMEVCHHDGPKRPAVPAGQFWDVGPAGSVKSASAAAMSESHPDEPKGPAGPAGRYNAEFGVRAAAGAPRQAAAEDGFPARARHGRPGAPKPRP